MVNPRNTTIHRGDIYLADLAPVVGSEQGGIRPVLIVQNDIGNQHSPTVIAAVITGQSSCSPSFGQRPGHPSCRASVRQRPGAAPCGRSGEEAGGRPGQAASGGQTRPESPAQEFFVR